MRRSPLRQCCRAGAASAGWTSARAVACLAWCWPPAEPTSAGCSWTARGRRPSTSSGSSGSWGLTTYWSSQAGPKCWHTRASSARTASGATARFDGVVARAVAPLAVLAELARGFIRDGGILAALKGPAWQDEVTAAATALSVLRYGRVHSEALPSPVRSTWLVTIPTEGSPPEGYPRRNGIPRTDPLR